MKLKLLSCTV